MKITIKLTILLVILLSMIACVGPLKKMRNADQHEVGIAYLNLETGEMLAYNAHTLYHAASTMKTPIMFQLFRMRDMGFIDLNGQVPVRNDFGSIVDGSRFSLPIKSEKDEILYPYLNKTMSYYDLMEKMITHSSNLATNILMEVTTADSISSTLELLGAKGVLVLRGVEDLKAYHLGLNNLTSAFGMMKVMEGVYRSDLVADSSRQAMLDILSRQVYNSMIPAGLPEDVRVAHKTGSITQIAHDAAIIFPEDAPPFILVILTRGWDDHAEASKVGARITSKVYDYHLGKLSRTDIVVPDLLK